jgi:hypothetical protein
MASAAPEASAGNAVAPQLLPRPTRHVVDPLGFFADRLPQVSLLEALDPDAWAKAPRTLRRRTSSHNRYKPRKRARSEAHAVRTAGSTLSASHAWTSRRMVMQPRFGIRMAARTSSMSLDAVLRIATTGCVLHDASYVRWLCVQGPREAVLDCLETHLDPSLGRLQPAPGQRLGPFMVHRAGAFPQGALAPVHVAFAAAPVRAKLGDDGEERVMLRVAVHCSMLPALLEELSRSLPPGAAAACAPESHTFSLIGPSADAVADAVLRPAAPAAAQPAFLEDAFFDGALDVDQLLARCPAAPASHASAGGAGVMRYPRAGTKTLQLGRGLDLVVEGTKAARALWQRLVLQGAVCAGLDDVEHLHAAMRVPTFPRDYPDSAASEEFWRQADAEAERRWASRPPSKRGAAVRPAASPDWRALLSGKDGDCAEWVVARGWTHVSAFLRPDTFASDEAAPFPGLLLRVVVTGPRMRRAAFGPASGLHVASDADYERFARGEPLDPAAARRALVGFVTSAYQGRSGVGLVSGHGWARLLLGAQTRKNKRKRLLVVFSRGEVCGPCYVSLASDV